MSFLCGVAAVAACVTASIAGAAPPPPSIAVAATAPSRAQLADFICQRALDPPVRAVSVTAVMRPIAGTVRLQMSFDLEQRVVISRGLH